MVIPLLKGGDPSDLNNYRPISRLLVKVFESLINNNHALLLQRFKSIGLSNMTLSWF